MSMYKTEWLEEDRQRMLRMERLYILDGRHRPTLKDGSPNPFHGIYTGLAAKAEDLEGFDGIV
jgi:hypothetical protein